MEDLRNHEFKNYIGGQWVACAAGKTYPNVNPADTDDIVGRFQASQAEDAAAAVAAAQAAFDGWRNLAVSSAPR